MTGLNVFPLLSCLSISLSQSLPLSRPLKTFSKLFEAIFRFIEIVNLFSIALASHNVRATVPSNIPVSNNFIPRDHLKTQSNMEKVERWSESKQMKLNLKKTKNICFNFSRDKQFNTDIKLNNESIETVNETKLLGTIISDDLKWNRNTDNIVKETNKRMQLLHKASKFTNNTRDLKQFICCKSGASWTNQPWCGIPASHKRIGMILKEYRSLL